MRLALTMQPVQQAEMPQCSATWRVRSPHMLPPALPHPHPTRVTSMHSPRDEDDDEWAAEMQRVEREVQVTPCPSLHPLPSPLPSPPPLQPRLEQRSVGSIVDGMWGGVRRHFRRVWRGE